jgi:hypothetical protein
MSQGVGDTEKAPDVYSDLPLRSSTIFKISEDSAAASTLPMSASTTPPACRAGFGRVLSRSTPPCGKALTWTVTAT